MFEIMLTDGSETWTHRERFASLSDANTARDDINARSLDHTGGEITAYVVCPHRNDGPCAECHAPSATEAHPMRERITWTAGESRTKLLRGHINGQLVAVIEAWGRERPDEGMWNAYTDAPTIHPFECAGIDAAKALAEAHAQAYSMPAPDDDDADTSRFRDHGYANHDDAPCTICNDVNVTRDGLCHDCHTRRYPEQHHYPYRAEEALGIAVLA